ncbi:MAG TPA: membrane protein insertase YidC [Candidatus Omnitrophota bacterium]|nr:membrane protein insertase YidC [Candidatus Omnitrophota bacterium]HPS36582.1 membrane protein insertase YidC [Candidatus Omnitrophota bacterium]
MDKNSIKAIFLAVLIVVLYPYAVKWFFPEAYKAMQPRQEQVSVAPAYKPTVKTETLAPVADKVFSQAPAPATVLVESPLYKIEFSTLGGTVTRLSFLGEHGREALTRTDFFDGDLRAAGIFGVNVLHEKANLSQTIFKMVRKGVRGEVIEFSYELPGEYQIFKTYTMHEDRPVIDLLVRIKNLTEKEKNIPIEIGYGMAYQEGYQKHYGYYDAVAYTDKTNIADLGKLKKKGYAFPAGTAWAGLIKKYFALLVKPDGKIVDGSARADEKNLFAKFILEPVAVPAGGAAEQKVLIYAGPQRYETLKSFGAGFENVFSRGFFGPFKTWILLVLKFFFRYTHNFGWALVILTLLIKLVFAPLTHLSYSSMKKMQALAPKQKAIQEHHKKDPAKAQQEIMALYRRNKVNPAMGCLPMLIQIPVFIAMFRLLPEAIELHGAPFIGWITDLSAPDKLMALPFTVPLLGWNTVNVLPVLMAASQVWYQRLMPQQPGSSPEQQRIMNFMPIFFGVICYNMPSGLTLYWTLQNMFSIIQQVFINRIVVVLHHEDQ